MRRVACTLAILLVLGLAAAACGTTAEYPIVGSDRAMTADGIVQVEEIEGGNRLVTVSIAHLPPPARLGEGLAQYVVWLGPEGQPPALAGKLGYDEETRQGQLMATTPHPRFVLKITAERPGTVAAPSDIVVAERKITAD